LECGCPLPLLLERRSLLLTGLIAFRQFTERTRSVRSPLELERLFSCAMRFRPSN
jgi:hypothetical protein